MKIAYVYVLLKDTSVGVLKKIKEQEDALNRLNDKTVDIVLFNSEQESFNGRIRHVKYFYKNIYVMNFLLLFAKYFLLQKSYDLSTYDKIILRYPGADFSGLGFMKKHKEVYLEYHAKLTEEFKSKIQNTNNILLKLIRVFRYWQEKSLGGRILKESSGIISMSDEISKELLSGIKKHIPNINIPNGINLKQVLKTGFCEFDGEKIKVVFIGSRSESWHGIDRLILSVQKFNKQNTSKNIELHFIGNIKLSDIDIPVAKTVAETLFFHGVKYDKELDAVMNKMHLAVCQLALYRKKLNELSTLKTCEYTARGIPFILAYNDPNLYNVDANLKFYKQFPNNDSIIDFEEVFEFMAEMQKKKKEILEYMEKYSAEHLDWTTKMREYIDFTTHDSE